MHNAMHAKPCLTSPIFVSIINPIALRKAKIVCNFGHSEYNRVKALVACW